jgi:hypothetical protein
MNISCCAYNTGEDSTIKCTMTQFEDQFSTIKPDGIQVRCHKQFCIIRCSTVPVPPRAVVAAAVVAAAAVETEGAADPGEGQDPQDLEQDGRFGFTRYLGVELTPIGGLCH